MKKEINAVYLPPVDINQDTFSDNFDTEFTAEPVVDSVVPENMLKAVPKGATDFEQWSFVGDESLASKKNNADPFKKEMKSVPEDDEPDPDMRSGSFEDVHRFLKKK